MADEEAPAAAPAAYDPAQIQALIDRLGIAPPTPPQHGAPGQGGVGGFLGDVGKALAGGGSGLLDLSPGESDKAGGNALLRMGINMLMASGPSYVPRGLGEIIGYGLQGAQEGYGGTEQAIAQRLAAQQAGGQQQFENRLASIKEALPLLQMQRAASIPNVLAGSGPGGGGKPGTSIADKLPGYGGAVNAPPAPPEYEQHFQDAAKAFNVPVALLKAITTQESGFNPNAKNGGLMQITAGTAKSPGYGMQGVDNPATLNDPRSNIMFGAEYLARRAKDIGADLSTPEGQAAALKAYNGGGDPKYVQKVFSYMPGSGTQTAAAAPPAAPGGPATPPPPYKVAGPTQPPPAATTAQPAGNLGLVRNPDGTVGTPNAGGLGTGGTTAPADSTTTPPPAPTRQTFEQFQALHPVAADPGTEAGIAGLEKAKQQAAVELQASVGPDRVKAVTAYNAAAKAVTDARTAAAKDARDTQRQLYDAEMQRQQAVEEADKGRAATAAEAERNRAAQVALETQKAEEARKTAAAATENSFTLDTRKNLTNERTASQETVDNLGLLDSLSKAAGEATTLDALSWGGQPLRQWLLEHHIGTQEQISHWGAQQAYEAAINQTITGLRKGVSMGQLSDRDLIFLSGMAPGVLQRPDTRDAITAYLRQSQLRKIRFVDTVEEMWDGGKGMTYGKALTEARKSLPEIVPVMPAGASNAEKTEFLTKKVPPGTLYRNANGDLTVWPGMPGAGGPGGNRPVVRLPGD